MENRIEAYFEDQIAACQTAAAALNGDDRADEAIFQRIRRNVFDIFRAVYLAGSNVHTEENARIHFLSKRLDEISDNWRTAQNIAREHGSSERAFVEQIKLEAAAEIRQKILQWSEEK